MPPEAPADVLRPLRRRAAVAWASWVLSLGLLWGEHQLRVLHPLSVPFLLLLVVTFGSALGALARGLSRALRGPRRAAALAWAGTGVLPALLWPALGWYGFRQW